MLFIAMTSGPRFALVGLWYLLTNRPGHRLPKFVAFWGVFRTLTCGGWTYVTSTDDHKWHDILMISYLVATIPWTFGCIALSPPNATAIKYRKYLAVRVLWHDCAVDLFLYSAQGSQDSRRYVFKVFPYCLERMISSPFHSLPGPADPYPLFSSADLPTHSQRIPPFAEQEKSCWFDAPCEQPWHAY